MKKLVFAMLLVGLFAVLLTPNGAAAAGPQWVVVGWGDNLSSIAVRYGTTVATLVQANHLPNADFVYAGQRLFIPASNYTSQPPASSPIPSAGSTAYYTVRAGDTLYSIATRFGTSMSAIATANRLWNYDFVYTGQVLKIPGATTAPSNPADAPAQPPANAPTAGKWIDINITTQRITAYEGSKEVYSALVSTGVAAHPTPVGRWKIYAKYSAYTMSGGTRGVDYYYLPNVPWTMFFYSGYAIHGTYWHNNFGHPMSHGCVNLKTSDAKWFYDWAPVGTTVVTHL